MEERLLPKERRGTSPAIDSLTNLTGLMELVTVKPGAGSLALGMIILSSLGLLSGIPLPAQASPSIVNIIVNSSFEDGLGPNGYPSGWMNWTKHGGGSCSATPACVSLDTSRFVTGTTSARLDLANLTIGFIAIAQSLPGTLRFRNLTDRPDGLDMWFYYEPKYAGSGDIRIRGLYGENVGEINYVFDPDPALSYPNSTAPTPYGPGGVKNIFLYGYAPGQWHHIERNLRADWEAPLWISNQTFQGYVQGFSLDIPFPRIQFDAIGFKLGADYSETVWIDDFKTYVDSTPTPFDFSLSSSGPITMTRGGFGSNMIAVGLVSGTPESVSLSCSAGLPFEASCSFNPQSDLPAFTSTLTINTTSSTPAGLFTIMVSGTGGGLTRTTQFLLRLNSLSRSGWSLDWEISLNDGVTIANVSFNETSILSDARLPGILSTYVDNYCGPFYDELLGINISPNQVFIEDLPEDSFQIRAVYSVPGERFQQIWRFHPNGTFLGLVRIGPGGCAPEHLYEARWRYDFYLASSDTLVVFDGSDWNEVSVEGEFFDEGSTDRLHNARWGIRGNSPAYFFSPFDSEPQNGTGTLLAVLNRPGEVELTHRPPTETPYVFLNNETLSGQDTAFWYLSRHSGSPFDPDIGIITGLLFRPSLVPQPPAGLPVVGVWSQTCGSSLISTSNPACGPLSPGSQITVQVNITDAPAFNGYDFTLYYDPSYLQADSTDVRNGTVFGSNVFVVIEDLATPGTLRLAVVSIGTVFSGGSGTLAHISFRILGTGVSPLVLAAGMTQPPAFARAFTILVLGANPIDVTTADGYFTNDPSRSGPIAAFSYSPVPGEQGEPVVFDASMSFDPDGTAGIDGIIRYVWDFGDGQVLAVEGITVVSHRYGGFSADFTGNFSVRLTVVDADGLLGMKTRRVDVEPRPLHDVAVTVLQASPSSVAAGELLNVTVVVSNLGTFDEIFNLTVTYGTPPTLLALVVGEQISGLESRQFVFVLDTTGLSPSFYQVEAVVSVALDDNELNNFRGAFFEVVRPVPEHDVAVVFVEAFPQNVVSGQFVAVNMNMINLGRNVETVDLVVYYDSSVAARSTGLTIGLFPNFAFVQLVWDTTGVAPGSYLISARVFLAGDGDESNNIRVDGIVTILPPPVITLTPDSGGLGTMVLVQGSGFPSPITGPGISPILVSLDDMFLGFVIAQDGVFNFTFNVPHAEPGLHTVKALDAASGTRAVAGFEVLQGQGTDTPQVLRVSVDVGVVYFPGDRAEIFVLTTLDGAPTSMGDVQLAVIIIRPDGSNTSLVPALLSPGLYKASFNVPRGTGSVGTYSVIARAHGEGMEDSSLVSFRVAPSWLSSNAPRITSAAAIIGAVAVVAVAWRKGYLRRNDEEQPLPFAG